MTEIHVIICPVSGGVWVFSVPKVAERSVRCLKVKSVNVCTNFVVYRCGEELGAGSDTYLIASGKPKVKRTGIGFPFSKLGGLWWW